MVGLTAALIAALVTVAPAAAQEPAQAPATQKAEPQASAGAPQTTKTVDVARGTRLELNNYAGEVIVRAWDRNAVRVDARHARLDAIQVEQKGDVVEVSSSRVATSDRSFRGRGGFGGSVDYEI